MKKTEALRNQSFSIVKSISKEGPDNAIQNSKILASAVTRAAEGVAFLEEKGAASENVVNKSFFLYMGVKKDAQRVIIEKIARSMGIELSPDFHSRDSDAGTGILKKEIDETLEDIFKIAHEVAADELEFYLNYAAVEQNKTTNSLILMLADLAKEFLFDMKIWYLTHKNRDDAVAGPSILQAGEVSAVCS